MTKWEYRFINISGFQTDITHALNEIGNDGWDVIAVQLERHTSISIPFIADVFCKRPIEEKVSAKE